MRIDVVKFFSLGPTSIQNCFFQEMQKLGVVEVISQQSPSLETPQEIQDYIDALHVLRRMAPVKQAPADQIESANVLARHVIERNEEIEHLQEQVRILEREISRVAIFGDFSLPNLREIEQETDRHMQFFFTKKSAELEAPSRPEVLYVGSAHEIDYYFTINEERRTYDDFIEILIERPLGELQEELAQIRRQIDEFETELATLAHQKKRLKQGLINTLNHYHLSEAKNRADTLLNGEAFAVEGWIPKNKIKELQVLADNYDVYIEQTQVEKKDKAPTYLENKRFGRLGEDLVSIYDTPANTDRDPSIWVFVAFGIFFSMIVADLGYGLLLLGISLYLLYKYGKRGGLGRRVILLATSLSIGCIIWGALITSFFGIDFAPNSPLRKISVTNWMVEQKAAYFLKERSAAYDDLIKEYPQLSSAKTPKELLMGVQKKTKSGAIKYTVYDTFTDNVMIELAIFIGAIHIIISFLRYLDRHWASLGWIVFMVGGYLFFPLILKATSLIHYIFHVPYVEGGAIGQYMVYIGLGLAAVLAIVQHRLRGLAEIMGVIQVFADVMSYLRIYALSLAGMIMGSTFDQIGLSMPIYIGIFVIFAGHTINFTLALMGGVIHGLRLNFIEWYHYSFDGGGKHFQPLTLLKLDGEKK